MDEIMFKPGKWYKEFDENGNIVKAVYDASYRRLLGFEAAGEYADARETRPAGIHPDDAERLNAHLADCLAKHPEGMDLDIEYRMQTKRGYRWFHDHAYVTRRADGSPLRADGILFDIQDTVDRTDEHRSMAENYTRILALEDDFEVLYDVELDTGRYDIFVKGQAFGDVNRNLINNNSFFDDVGKNLSVVHPEDRQGNFDTTRPDFIREALSKNDHFDRYYRLMVDGEPAWARMRTVYKDADKKNVIIGVFNAEKDVQAKQIAEQNALLKEEQKRTDILHEIIHSGKWSFFVNEKDEIVRADVSEEVNRIIRNNIPGDGHAWLGIVHPEDRAAAEAAFNAAIRDHSCNTPYDVNYRMIGRDGVYRWFHSAGRVVRGKDGNGEFYGVHIDITNQIEEQLAQQKQLEKALEKAGGEAARRDAIYAISGSSPWSYEIGADDTVLSVRYGDELVKQTSVSYAKDQMAWAALIHPEDRERALDAFAASIRDHSGNTPYDEVYRILIKDGSYRWFRSAGRIIRRNDGSGEFIGMATDITKQIEDQERYTKQLRDAEDTEKLLESVSDAYRFAFAFDMAGSYFRVIRMDDEVKKATGADSFDNYREAIAPLSRLIHPADTARMAHELDFDTIRRKLADVSSYSVEYRILNDGVAEWHEMHVTHIARDEIAMGFGEKDFEITLRHINDTRFKEYFGLYEADLDTGMLKVIVDSPYYTFSETGKPVPYAPAMKKFAGNQQGETKEAFLKLADPAWIRETLSEDDRHSLTYYSVTAGNTWVDVTLYVTMRHEDGTPAVFALGYSFVSATEAARQEMQRRLNESSHMISGLASGYVGLYYINMDEELFTVYTLDRERFPETGRIVNEGKDPFEMLRAFGASKLVHPDDRHLFSDMSRETIRKRLSGQKRFSIRFRRLNGNVYTWNEMNVVKSENSDEQANAIVLGFADCDEEIKKELEQQKRLEDALSAAEIANRAKTDFLFNMSHDIRTPMNAIIGFTNLAKKEINEPEKALDSLEKVQRSSDILLNLINDVLDMSRIESGKAELHEEKHAVTEAFDSIAPAMASLAAAKDIDLRFGIGGIRDKYVFVDGPRFDRVLINIISNAIKYTPAGGFVKVTARQSGRAKPGWGNYVFTVADNGIGMSEEFQQHMFEDFTREENSTTSGIQGTGLGLPLAKRLISMMGGTISCVSAQGAGTTFTLEFPFRLQTEADRTEAAANTRERTEIDLKGKRALLVEDNELNREIAEDILSGEGIGIETAENGRIAVDKVLERGADWYDFILMDIQMPLMNGYEATAEIRRLMPELRAPIIALSANAFAEDKKKSLEAGMDDHVAKPIDIKALFAALERHLR